MEEMELAWSPDGLWLSVHRCGVDSGADCLDHEDLVVSTDGRSAQQLPGRPVWSPDGRRLAVQAQNGDLLVGSPDGSNLRSIGAFPMPLSWSPDASQFAFIRNGNAWIANAEGTGQRNATNFAHGDVYDATWSPDGRFMAVIQESQLWILALDGDELRPIALGPGRTSFHGLSWSPDSARLAVVVEKVEGPATLIVRIEDGSATAMDNGGIPYVAWSPDGRFIALLEKASESGQIDIANSDGSGRHKVGTTSDGSSRITWVR
jgi:Tol biopolymer transport system component